MPPETSLLPLPDPAESLNRLESVHRELVDAVVDAGHSAAAITVADAERPNISDYVFDDDVRVLVGYLPDGALEDDPPAQASARLTAIGDLFAARARIVSLDGPAGSWIFTAYACWRQGDSIFTAHLHDATRMGWCALSDDQIYRYWLRSGINAANDRRIEGEMLLRDQWGAKLGKIIIRNAAVEGFAQYLASRTPDDRWPVYAAAIFRHSGGRRETVFEVKPQWSSKSCVLKRSTQQRWRMPAMVSSIRVSVEALC